MDLKAAEKLARELMNQHGVGHLPLEWNRSKTKIGMCHFIGIRSGRKMTLSKATKISLSRHFIPHLTEDKVRNTILHEIAHALAGYEAGHGTKWKEVARRIGAEPKACSYVPEAHAGMAAAKVHKYNVVCECSVHKGAVIGYRNRKPKYSMVCQVSKHPVKFVPNY